MSKFARFRTGDVMKSNVWVVQALRQLVAAEVARDEARDAGDTSPRWDEAVERAQRRYREALGPYALIGTGQR